MGSFFRIFKWPGAGETLEALMVFSSRSVILSVAEGSFRLPGYRTLSDPGTVQAGAKQPGSRIVLAGRKIFPIENHLLTLR